jgi:hypothetical protein
MSPDIASLEEMTTLDDEAIFPFLEPTSTDIESRVLERMPLQVRLREVEVRPFPIGRPPKTRVP